jgi:diadenosine tetraphosphatase ApaH/serine/threonine PP2A family protein phosphatase
MEVYSYKNDDVAYTLNTELKLQPDEKYIINVGSVGQPRDRDPRVSFCIYDSDNRLVTLKRLAYNIKAAADKIIAKGLPRILADRLSV